MFFPWKTTEDDEDELDEEEVAEERQNALDAFEGIDTEDCGSLGKERCEDLFSALGTTYCEEKHARHMNKLCAKDGRVHKDEFVSWYIEWVFADNEDDEDDDEDESSKPSATAAPSSGFGDLGKLQAGEWKCPACSIKNVAASAKCIACETPNPNTSATAAPAAAAAASTRAMRCRRLRDSVWPLCVAASSSMRCDSAREGGAAARSADLRARGARRAKLPRAREARGARREAGGSRRPAGGSSQALAPPLGSCSQRINSSKRM